MRKRLVAGATLIAAAVVLVLNVVPSSAQQQPQPIAIELLTPRSTFPDNVDLKFKIKHPGERRIIANDKNPDRTVVARITLQPNAKFPWHSHAGPVVVNVAEGELVYQDASCAERVYPAGTAFVDPGFGHVHTAWNNTGGETVLVATFFSAPAQGPLLIPAAPRCP